MDLNDVYLHGISICDNSDFTDTLLILEKILKSDNLFSLALQDKYDETRIGYNGLHYISLCDYTKINNVYNKKKKCINFNAFNFYIKRSLSLALTKEKIEVEKPILLSPNFMSRKSEKEMLYLINHPYRRFSDYPDEVLAKNIISLNNLEFLTIPIEHFINNNKNYDYNCDLVIDLLREVRNLLKKYKYEKPIYDLETLINLDDNLKVKQLLKKDK